MWNRKPRRQGRPARGARALCAIVLAALSLLAPSILGGAELPAGLAVFDDLKEQFTIAVPEGWHSYDQGGAVTGKPGTVGRVIFSAEEIPGLHLARIEGTDYEVEYKDPQVNARAREVAAALDRGTLPSFIVDRISLERSRKGMSCASFTKRFARSAALYQISTDSGHSGRAKPVAFPDAFTMYPIEEIGGCRGHRIRGESTLGDPPDSERWLIDVRAVSDGQTVYLFIARGAEQHLPGILETFEKALSTLELAKAPG